MAKKSLSYGPSESLIRGAAAIGQSKLPADMKGLQAITMFGSQKIEQQRQRVAEARKNIDASVSEILINNGALGNTHFEYATKQANLFKEDYMRGVVLNNAEGEILKNKALNSLAKLSNGANEEQQLKLNFAKNWDAGLYTTNLDITDSEVLKLYSEDKYTLDNDKDGNKIYTFDISGVTVTQTYEDIKELTNRLKDGADGNKTLSDEFGNVLQNHVFNQFFVGVDEDGKSKFFKRGAAEQYFLNLFKKSGIAFSDQMADNRFNTKTIKEMLLADTTLLDEVTKVIKDIPDIDNEQGIGINDVVDALLNHKNSAFKEAFENGSIQKVIANRLTNALLNENAGLVKNESKINLPGEKNKKTTFSINRNVVNPAFSSDSKKRDFYVGSKDISVVEDKLNKLYNNESFPDFAGNMYEPEFRGEGENKKVVGYFVYAQDASLNTKQTKEGKSYLLYIGGDERAKEEIRRIYLGLESYEYKGSKGGKYDPK
jgi:hypothetical protein